MNFVTEFRHLFSPNVVSKYVANPEAQIALRSLLGPRLSQLYRYGWPKHRDHPLDFRRFTNDRTLVEYCELSAMEPEDIYNLAHPQRLSSRLKRPIRIGDIGCGKASALASFLGDSNVQAIGIDTEARDLRVNNIRIYRDDALDKESDFWHEQYDYLFCILSAHYIDSTLNAIIKRMRRGLTKGGKGYIVVPLGQISISEYTGMTLFSYKFDKKSLTEHGLRIITDVPDKTGVSRNIGTGNETCVAIQFENS